MEKRIFSCWMNRMKYVDVTDWLNLNYNLYYIIQKNLNLSVCSILPPNPYFIKCNSPLLQISQCCFIPKCLTLWCLYRALYELNSLSHSLHLILFRSCTGLCIIACSFKSHTSFPHSSHTSFFFICFGRPLLFFMTNDAKIVKTVLNKHFQWNIELTHNFDAKTLMELFSLVV